MPEKEVSNYIADQIKEFAAKNGRRIAEIEIKNHYIDGSVGALFMVNDEPLGILAGGTKIIPAYQSDDSAESVLQRSRELVSKGVNMEITAEEWKAEIIKLCEDVIKSGSNLGRIEDRRAVHGMLEYWQAGLDELRKKDWMILEPFAGHFEESTTSTIFYTENHAKQLEQAGIDLAES